MFITDSITNFVACPWTFVVLKPALNRFVPGMNSRDGHGGEIQVSMLLENVHCWSGSISSVSLS